MRINLTQHEVSQRTANLVLCESLLGSSTGLEFLTAAAVPFATQSNCASEHAFTSTWVQPNVSQQFPRDPWREIYLLYQDPTNVMPSKNQSGWRAAIKIILCLMNISYCSNAPSLWLACSFRSCSIHRSTFIAFWFRFGKRMRQLLTGWWRFSSVALKTFIRTFGKCLAKKYKGPSSKSFTEPPRCHFWEPMTPVIRIRLDFKALVLVCATLPLD